MMAILSALSQPFNVYNVAGDMVAVLAAWRQEINRLTIALSERADPTHPATSDPSSYTLTAPDGPLSVVSATADGFLAQLELDRRPPDAACTIKIADETFRSVDGMLSDETTLDFRGVPDPPPEPVDPPIVTDWDPEIGSTIGRRDEIAFSVLSASELATVIVWVRFDDIRQAALAFDSQTFRDNFTGSVEPIEGGRRYTLRRMTGWLSPPTVVVHATNCDGEETLYVHH